MNENFNNKVAKFVINEILPRSKKAGCDPIDFIHPSVVNELVKCEIQGRIYRNQTREFLDHYLQSKESFSENTKIVLNNLAIKVNYETAN